MRKDQALRNGYSREFEIFWSMSWRAGGKIAAYEEWLRLERLRLLPALVVLLKALNATHDTRAFRAGYVPHVRTWLHQGRWEDANEATVGWKDEKDQSLWRSYCAEKGLDPATGETLESSSEPS